ncbi:hypothetical protein AAMO2058_000086300 [Amorphochlora amoebiformis]
MMHALVHPYLKYDAATVHALDTQFRYFSIFQAREVKIVSVGSLVSGSPCGHRTEGQETHPKRDQISFFSDVSQASYHHRWRVFGRSPSLARHDTTESSRASPVLGEANITPRFSKLWVSKQPHFYLERLHLLHDNGSPQGTGRTRSLTVDGRYNRRSAATAPRI